MRRTAQLEQDRAELIAIVQELEKRCQVVVNRQESAVLKDVPSWKTAPVTQGPKRFRGGMRTWAENRRKLEKQKRVGTAKMQRRTEEFKQVLSGTFGTQAETPVHEETGDEQS